MDDAATPRTVRIGALGDIHHGRHPHGVLARRLHGIERDADMLLIAGDLTAHGRASEAIGLADELAGFMLPIVAVLGNHDYHEDQQETIRATLEAAGIIVLEGECTVLDIGGARVGIAGIKGFGGGFEGACGSMFGEREMKSFMQTTRTAANTLERLLLHLTADLRIALLHYSPAETTVAGERLEIFPFLGSHLLGDAIDEAGADLALHGHAHAGTEVGRTPGGVPVRNVADHVIDRPYAVYPLVPGHGTAHPARDAVVLGRG